MRCSPGQGSILKLLKDAESQYALKVYIILQTTYLVRMHRALLAVSYKYKFLRKFLLRGIKFAKLVDYGLEKKFIGTSTPGAKTVKTCTDSD